MGCDQSREETPPVQLSRPRAPQQELVVMRTGGSNAAPLRPVQLPRLTSGTVAPASPSHVFADTDFSLVTSISSRSNSRTR